MKITALTTAALVLCQITFGQVSGNVNYQNQVRFPDSHIYVETPQTSNILITVKGLINVKADTYVAIFNVTQVGKTTEEVNDMLDKRLAQSLAEIKLKPGVETFVDMVSFVPVYEYEAEKKIFSKKTYNEIPAGFELKKNIHIQYTDPNLLHDFITILSRNEIYDLVRVDYLASTMETLKKELAHKAREVVQEKIKLYEVILGESLTSIEKRVSDEYKVALPIEMYKSYDVYSNTSLNLRKSSTVAHATKSPTLYYQPIMDKEFDFVVNPVILEPVVQVMYEIKVLINREKTLNAKPVKEYLIITPSGEMKNLDLKK